MELEQDKTYRLEMRGETVRYVGYDPDYLIKDGHKVLKGFHIFVGAGNRRIALSDEEVSKRVSAVFGEQPTESQ